MSDGPLHERVAALERLVARLRQQHDVLTGTQERHGTAIAEIDERVTGIEQLPNVQYASKKRRERLPLAGEDEQENDATKTLYK